MSDTLAAPDHSVTATHDGFTIKFHPAFASVCECDSKGAKHKLYEQKKGKPFRLPDGEHPTFHVITVSAAGREDLVIEITDRSHTLAAISLKLYDKPQDKKKSKKERNAGQLSLSGTTITIENDAETCPPDCTEDPGPTPPRP